MQNNKTIYFDFECEHNVTLEGTITRQYEYFKRPGYTLEQFAENNFYLIPDEDLPYFLETYGEPEGWKDHPSALVAEGIIPEKPW